MTFGYKTASGEFLDFTRTALLGDISSWEWNVGDSLSFTYPANDKRTVRLRFRTMADCDYAVAKMDNDTRSNAQGQLIMGDWSLKCNLTSGAFVGRNGAVTYDGVFTCYGNRWCRSSVISFPPTGAGADYPPNIAVYNQTTWAEWAKGSGATYSITDNDLEVVNITASSGSVAQSLPVTLKTSTAYGILVSIGQNSLPGTISVNSIGTFSGSSQVIVPAVTSGVFKLTETTLSTITTSSLIMFSSETAENVGKSYSFGKVRLFELPSGSQIANDFANLTAAQLDVKYPYVPVGAGADYPHDYPFDFLPPVSGSKTIEVDSYGPCDFMMTIYGPCESPSVNIGGNVHKVNVTVPSGAILFIDSTEKRQPGAEVFMRASDGTITNCFASREKGQPGSGAYIFEQIQPGTQIVSWAGTFGFDLEVIESRTKAPDDRY